MNDKQNIEDLKHIRNLMERSSKFMSLSGLSLVSAGVVALMGAAVAYFLLFQRGMVKYDEHFRALGKHSTEDIRIGMAVLAIVILLVATASAYFFLFQKSKKAGQKLWTPSAKRTFTHFIIPLFTGGIFCFALMLNNNIHFIGSAMLVFYGLGLVNSSKFTVKEIYYLGIAEIALGLLAGFLLNYGLIFWILGFGIMNIIAGLQIYFKYDRK